MRSAPTLLCTLALFGLVRDAHAGDPSCKDAAGSPPAGWDKPGAFACHQSAADASLSGDLDRCAADARTAIELEPHLETRALLAQCLEASNRYYAAHAAEMALVREARKAGKDKIARAAEERAAAIKENMPVLKLMVPDGVSRILVRVDDRELAGSELGRGMYLDPGKHHIVARGRQDGLDGVLDETVDLKPGQPAITMLLVLKPGVPEWASPSQAECMKRASTRDELAACVERRDDARDINVRVGTEVSAYHDSMDVDVISPVLSFGLEHVIGGWGVGASALADVVTAASVDIVATASPHWRELRLAPEIHGHVRFDPVDLSLGASLSHEPDYLATTVGGGLAVDFLDKNLTLGLLYQYSHDINGRTETPFSVFSTLIDRHAGTASLGIVFDKATFGQLSFTYVYENGDASKPYRHVPMFSPEVAPSIQPGLGIDSVNLARLPQRPLEQLPDRRMRFAGTGLIAHRFSSSTLRLSERLYRDDWGTMATTTDFILFVDIVKELRLWPHLRLHAQDGADFYQLAYVVEHSSRGVIIPALRTGDRELGPLVGATLGGGLRWDIGHGEVVSLILSGDAIYTRFLDHLFVKHRWGAFGALAVEVSLE